MPSPQAPASRERLRRPQESPPASGLKARLIRPSASVAAKGTVEVRCSDVICMQCHMCCAHVILCHDMPCKLSVLLQVGQKRTIDERADDDVSEQIRSNGGVNGNLPPMLGSQTSSGGASGLSSGSALRTPVAPGGRTWSASANLSVIAAAQRKVEANVMERNSARGRYPASPKQISAAIRMGAPEELIKEGMFQRNTYDQLMKTQKDITDANMEAHGAAYEDKKRGYFGPPPSASLFCCDGLTCR